MAKNSRISDKMKMEFDSIANDLIKCLKDPKIYKNEILYKRCVVRAFCTIFLKPKDMKEKNHE